MKRIRAQYMINYPEHLRLGEFENEWIKKEINNGILNEIINQEVIDYDNEVDCNGNMKCKSGSDLSDTDVSGVISHPVRINPTKPAVL